MLSFSSVGVGHVRMGAKVEIVISDKVCPLEVVSVFTTEGEFEVEGVLSTGGVGSDDTIILFGVGVVSLLLG